jgi:nucleotide-binding universal stress UspA family protein
MNDNSGNNNGLIVVGVDGSEGAKAALRFALDEAKLRQATLRAVHTWQFGYTGGFGLEGYAPVAGADFSDMRRAAEVALDATLHAAVLDDDDVVIERRIVEGGAATVLVDESRNADLLVVGSRGHGGFAGLLLGSVSQQCAQHAACPVVIVRAWSGSR